MSLKKMIQKMMNELGEAIEEMNFAQLKLKKAENNAQKVFECSKTRRCFPFLTAAQAKERRKGRKTESVLDNIRVIASIYNAVF